ncbi:MAG: ABC transporter ATP-binding protein [Acidobacteria bacterium]|nr:MAG: ABC transporter ATP-binding protein [Acidobacteriota bacterium]
MKLLNLFGANANLAAISRRYVWTAFVVTFLALSIGLLEGVGVSLLIPLLSTFTGSFTAANSGGALGLIERFAQGYSRNERLLIVTSVIFAFVVLKSVFQVVANVFATWVEGRVGQDIRCALYSFFLVQEPARLLNILATESWKASDAVRILLNRIAAIAAVLVFSVLLLLVSWRLSLIVLAGGLIARLVQRRTDARIRELSDAVVSANELLADQMLFTIFGARIIRLFHSQQAEHNRFETVSDGVRRSILKGARIYGTQGPLLEAMHGVLFLVVLLMAVFTSVSLPVLAAFLVLMNRVQPHLRALEQSAASLASAAGSFNEVEWLLKMRDNPPAPRGELGFSGLTNGIEFDKVSFEYSDRGEPALRDVSFELRRGRSTALIGESGAGKSTVVNLICRLLEPSAGTIRVDGQPLSRIKISDWLNAIAIAGQDIDLIDGTIAENISYGRPEIARTKIEQAAWSAGAGFVNDLAQGLETLVGPRGLSLSGGERQRIGIARALARDPDILILDEATNAIDHETQSGIIMTLRDLPKSMTIIVVSHRPSTLAFCDDAVVLSRGRVVETGPLSSVLSYRTMEAGTAGQTRNEFE